ncbi:MAG TPA: cupin domain-containing protein [Gemmatimonadales bacterium]
MPEYFQHLPNRVGFAPSRMTKLDCFRSGRLFVGLNCFEPGQTQPAHVHAGADKVYVVLSGKATFRVGDETRDAGPQDLVIAPAGVAHGVDRVAERTVVLVAIAPAPGS